MALRALTITLLGLLLATAPASAQWVAWWDFTPRLLPPTDSLALRSDVEDRPAEAAAVTGIPLGRWLDGESSVGVDVTRLRPDLGLSRLAARVEPAAGMPYRLIDTNLQSTAVSVDFKLTWPSRQESSGINLLQPYLAFGPALFVAERNPFANPLGTLADVAVRIGVKAGAGITWQFDQNAAFFGEYRLTRGMEDPLLSSSGRLGSGSGVRGYDLLYGIRLKF